MADEDDDQKTEEPTGKKLSQAYERGQFAKSPEMQVLFMLSAVLAGLGFTARAASRDIGEYAVSMFSRFGHMQIERDTVASIIAEAMLTVGRASAPVLAGCVGAALLAGSIQSGFRLAPEAVGFKPEALDPMAGFGRIFNKGIFVKAGIDFLKLLAIGYSAYLGARGLMYDPLFSSPVEASYLGQFLNQATVIFLSRVIFALGIVTALSYGYEKFKTHKQMMMTKQEVKDENKNAEGNTQAKGAMRRMARRLLQKQMLKDVATADVVVTNPTHFAVALKYERGRDQAPIVLAKGENRFAQRLKALAAEHGVPTVENKPVARLLYAMGEVGETIPPGLYQAVAEILAVVYRTHRYYFHQLRTRRLEAAA